MEESEVVATTRPFASVARSDEGTPVIARFVVVALVVVLFLEIVLSKYDVDDAKTPLFAQMGEVVAAVTRLKFVSNWNGSCAPVAVASVPQYRMPPVVDFTSQFAADRLSTASEVEVAFVVVVFAKMLPPVNVLFEYIFGMVVEASMKAIALVVDHERPVEVKKFELVVEKKLFTFFQVSLEVVENERPTDVKYADELVEKKSRALFQASLLVVLKERPTEVK